MARTDDMVRHTITSTVWNNVHARKSNCYACKCTVNFTHFQILAENNVTGRETAIDRMLLDDFKINASGKVGQTRSEGCSEPNDQFLDKNTGKCSLG